MKNVNVTICNYLKTVANGSVEAGISTGTLQNGGVGLPLPSMIGIAGPQPN